MSLLREENFFWKESFSGDKGLRSASKESKRFRWWLIRVIEKLIVRTKFEMSGELQLLKLLPLRWHSLRYLETFATQDPNAGSVMVVLWKQTSVST